MRIAVVGLGGAGSHAARFLAAQGHEVVGFERFSEGHGRGSSHGASRIIRYAYEDAAFTRLMRLAFPAWEEFEQAADEELVVRCGGLSIGPREHPRIQRTRAALVAQGIAFEEVSATEAARRWPVMRLASDEVAIFQADAGFVRASRCVSAAWRLARSAGASLRSESQVVDVSWRGGRAIVRTAPGPDSDSDDFDACIVAAGAWTGRLVPSLASSLVVLKQQVLHLACDAPGFSPSELPVWIDQASHDYGFPRDGVSSGVKVAHHLDGVPVDPDRDDRSVDLARERGLVDRVRARFPDLRAEIVHAQACLYTMAPDERFVLQRVPDAPGIVVVSACSGHGFKFTPLIGRLAADLALGGELPKACEGAVR